MTDPEIIKGMPRMKILSVLVAVMFVSIMTVYPIIDCGYSSAVDEEDEEEELPIPDDILNEYIAEELERINDLTESQMLDEFGVSMDEYKESMEALAGTAIILEGDGSGSIEVKVIESVDRGRAGPWYEGDYFYFGIESGAWSAIKWWFSSDCINMLVDQACKGNIDAVAIAEQEFQSINDTIDSLSKQISDLDGTIEDLKQKIDGLEQDIKSSIDSMNEAYDSSIECDEEILKFLNESSDEKDEAIKILEEAITELSAIPVEMIAECDPETLESLSDILEILSVYVSIASDYTLNNIDKYPGAALTVGAFVSCLLNKDMDGAIREIGYVAEGGGMNLCVNYLTGELDKIVDEFKSTKEGLKKANAELKASIKQIEESIRDSNIAKNKANEELKKATQHEIDVDEKINNLKTQDDKLSKLLSTEEKRYYESIMNFENIKEQYSRGEISDEVFDKAFSDHMDVEKKYLDVKEKSEQTKIALNTTQKEKHATTLKITEEKGNIAKETKKIQEEKKVIKAKKLNTLKNDLKVAKNVAKATAKATAKSSCKAAICATGIGAVIMVALDVVMALLIKFIEDHFDANGMDTTSDYGVYIKVKIKETYTVYQEIRILWSTCIISFSVTVYCIPSFEGVYMQ